MAAETYQNYLHDALDRVEQTSTVEAFHWHFEAIRDLVSSSHPWLPEAYFASQFVYGLRNDIQGYVMKFQPINVIDAFHLACIYEYELSNASNSSVAILQTQCKSDDISLVGDMASVEGVTVDKISQASVTSTESGDCYSVSMTYKDDFLTSTTFANDINRVEGVPELCLPDSSSYDYIHILAEDGCVVSPLAADRNIDIVSEERPSNRNTRGFDLKDTDMRRVSYGEEWNPPQNAKLYRCFSTESPELNDIVVPLSGNDNEFPKITSSKSQSGYKDDLLLALMRNITCSLHVNCLLYVFQGNYNNKSSSLVKPHNTFKNLVVSRALLEAKLLMSNDTSIYCLWKIAWGVEENSIVVPNSDKLVVSVDLQMDSVSSKTVHQEGYNSSIGKAITRPSESSDGT